MFYSCHYDPVLEDDPTFDTDEIEFIDFFSSREGLDDANRNAQDSPTADHHDSYLHDLIDNGDSTLLNPSKTFTVSPNDIHREAFLLPPAPPQRSSSFPLQDTTKGNLDNIIRLLSTPEATSTPDCSSINNPPTNLNLQSSTSTDTLKNKSSKIEEKLMTKSSNANSHISCNLELDLISEENQLAEDSDKVQRNSWTKAMRTSGYSSMLSIERFSSHLGSSIQNLFLGISNSSDLGYSKISGKDPGFFDWSGK